MRVLMMLEPSLFWHDWISDNTVADVAGVSRKAEWLVGEAWGSLLGKVGYRTPEVFSGSVSRKAGVSYTGSCLDSLPRKVGLPCLGSFASLHCGHAGSFSWKFLWHLTVDDRIACAGIHPVAY